MACKFRVKLNSATQYERPALHVYQTVSVKKEPFFVYVESKAKIACLTIDSHKVTLNSRKNTVK